MPGQHLVFVRYSSDHVPDLEWVYNLADIDHSKVVWARDMGAQHNAELVQYFKDRQVWVVEPDVIPPKLSAYVSNQQVVNAGMTNSVQGGVR